MKFDVFEQARVISWVKSKWTSVHEGFKHSDQTHRHLCIAKTKIYIFLLRFVSVCYDG
jgi:hypothetical protein